MTVFQIIMAVLHCLVVCPDCVMAYYALSCKCCCELGLCLASSVHVSRVRYRPIYGRRYNHKVADSAIDIAISSNRYEPHIASGDKMYDKMLTNCSSSTVTSNPVISCDNIQIIFLMSFSSFQE